MKEDVCRTGMGTCGQVGAGTLGQRKGKDRQAWTSPQRIQTGGGGARSPEPYRAMEFFP